MTTVWIHFSTETIDALQRNFHMDELPKSVKDETSAIRFQNELSALLARGRFRLKKWSSSSCRVLAEIPNQKMASPSVAMKKPEASFLVAVKQKQSADNLIWHMVMAVPVFSCCFAA